MNNLGRIFLEGEQCLTPAISCFGHVRCTEARKGIYAHQHPECFEIFYFIRGHVRWWVGDQTYDLLGNQVLLHPPGVMHGSEKGILQPCEYIWLNIHEPTLRRRNDPHWNDLLGRLHGLKHACFPGDSNLGSVFQVIFKELRSPDALSKINVEVSLLQIVVHVLRCYERLGSSATPTTLSAPIKASMDWCQAHLPEATTDGMRAAARLPMEHFRLVFRKEVGITPLAHIHLQKIDAAKRLLLEGKTVTATAHALGFSSSQHLATLFRKIEGITPTELRASRNTRSVSEIGLRV